MLGSIPLHSIDLFFLQSLPSAAPVIVSARMLNATAAFVAWNALDGDDANGKITGYQVSRVIYLKALAIGLSKSTVSQIG